jgi:hypothetical protein
MKFEFYDSHEWSNFVKQLILAFVLIAALPLFARARHSCAHELDFVRAKIQEQHEPNRTKSRHGKSAKLQVSEID